jgi:predicted DNA binding CopG/RHH family protein
MLVVDAPDVLEWLRENWTGECEWDQGKSHGQIKKIRYELFHLGVHEKMKKKSMIQKTNTTADSFDELFENTDFGVEVKNPILVTASERKGGRPKIGRKLSIILPEELISILEKAAKKKGVGYQTMIRIICTEKVDEYLNDKSNAA